ncbi:hypothetical protein ACFL3V_04455 [Nanoarchaeota archaeon]
MRLPIIAVLYVLFILVGGCNDINQEESAAVGEDVPEVPVVVEPHSYCHINNEFCEGVGVIGYLNDKKISIHFQDKLEHDKFIADGCEPYKPQYPQPGGFYVLCDYTAGNNFEKEGLFIVSGQQKKGKVFFVMEDISMSGGKYMFKLPTE